MGTRISIGTEDYEVTEFAVTEDSSPLAAGDTSGSVGGISFSFPTPSPESTYPTQTWINLFTNPRMETASGAVLIENPARPGTFIGA